VFRPPQLRLSYQLKVVVVEVVDVGTRRITAKGQRAGTQEGGGAHSRGVRRSDSLEFRFRLGQAAWHSILGTIRTPRLGDVHC
jgi:hypothetical protein